MGACTGGAGVGLGGGTGAARGGGGTFESKLISLISDSVSLLFPVLRLNFGRESSSSSFFLTKVVHNLELIFELNMD